MNFDEDFQYSSDLSKYENSKESYGSSSGGELGFSGINIVGGEIDWEYQKNLRNFKTRMQVYRKMRADGSVDTALRLIELPLLGQTAWIVPASDDTKDLEIAEFVADNIIEESNISTTYSFQDHLAEEVKYFQFGFMPFEIIYGVGDWIKKDGKVKKNMVILKKLAVRHPETLDEWKVNVTSDTGIDGIKQEMPSGDLTEKFKGVSEIFIPIDKLLIYVNDKIGDLWEGVSVLRSVYKHLMYKDGLYKIEAIGLQKNATTIPIIYLKNPSNDRIVKAKKLIRNFIVNEDAGFVLNEERERIDHYEGGISTVAIHRSIAHHDSKILQNVLAGFMLLGQESRGGARNLGSSLMEFFMMSMEAKVKYSAQIKNRYLIPKLVDRNFTNVKRYPKIVNYAGRIVDKSLMADILKILGADNDGQGSYIDPTDISVKDYVHKVFGIPRSDELKDKTKKEEKRDKTVENLKEKINPKDKNDESKLSKSLNFIIDLQREELCKVANKLLKFGSIPNINYLETPHMDKLNNVIRKFSDIDDNNRKNICDNHDLSMRCNVIESIMNVARERKTL